MKKLRSAMVLSCWLAVPARASHNPEFPLRTKGRYIVDQSGARVHWRAVNWYGSHLEHEVPGGLDHQPLDKVVELIKKWGFNVVRLPFSNQMLRSNTPVPKVKLLANPFLWEKTPLQVLDAVIDALAQEQIMVVLNNHTTTSMWCCGFDTNALWFSEWGGFSMSETAWEQDWLMLAERYGHNPWVVAADLRNEVRTGHHGIQIDPQSPEWGGGGPRDWHRAAQSVGRKIIETGVPWLIVVEGLNWQGLIPVVGSGRRPHLQPVHEFPVQLIEQGRLVYGVHTYGYTGPEHTGDDRTSPGKLRYKDLSRSELFATFDREFGYLLEANFFYTAPVWLSEFGVGAGQAGFGLLEFQSPFLNQNQEKAWFANLADYIQQKGIDFAYWPLNPESYGLVRDDWSDIKDDDWRSLYLRQMLLPSLEVSPQVQKWTLMDLRLGDFFGDHDLKGGKAPVDWLSGATKAACPTDQRVLGLSQNYRALCGALPGQTQFEYPRVPVVVEAVHQSQGQRHSSRDWATGMTKYECPVGFLVTGITKHWWGFSGIRCHQPAHLKPQSCETLWFDRHDLRNSVSGGDFAVNVYKGQCRDEEYLAGVAHHDGTPAALLCCQAQQPP